MHLSIFHWNCRHPLLHHGIKPHILCCQSCGWKYTWKQYICFWLWSSCFCSNPVLRPCSQRLPPNTRGPASLSARRGINANCKIPNKSFAKCAQIFFQMCSNVCTGVRLLRWHELNCTFSRKKFTPQPNITPNIWICLKAHDQYIFFCMFTFLPP